MTARRRWRLFAVAAGAALLLAGCAMGGDQSALRPDGPAARKIDNLFEPVFWIAAGVFFLVEGLILIAIIRFRRRPGRDRAVKQIHGNRRLEVIWTLIPAVLLAGIAVPTVGTIFQLAREPAGALQITVTGKQWWWDVQYPVQGVHTANEIHIPVGQPVYISLESDNVIHSFWVPRLAGKQDVVPGRTNHLTLEADQPGVYEGQCVEFCGASHANMRLRLFAQTQADFQAWVVEQLKDSVQPTGDLATKGMEIFMRPGLCSSCHAIQGTDAAAQVGPNLTHFASRTRLAGEILDNTPENVATWLHDPPAVKPGSLMPNYHLTQDEIQALVAYLEGLK